MRKFIAYFTCLLILAAPAAFNKTPAKADGPPNVVIILTDDQRQGSESVMPTVQSQIAAKGVHFLNGMVPTSLCCPSRASILRGEFAHSTKVWGNNPNQNGGWKAFYDNGGEDSNLATWLDAEGYETGLFGKYLNKYSEAPHANNIHHVPGGWDRWDAFLETDYYDYKLVQEDGTKDTYGTANADYSTDVIAGDAVDFIMNTPDNEPLFAYIAPYGPHPPFTPAPRDVGTCSGLANFRPPSYNVVSSGAPAWAAALPAWSATKRAKVDQDRRDACETVGSVDDLVGSVIGALNTEGRLSNTLIIFASDNGFMWGEHRIWGKSVPYDYGTRVSMYARWDGHINYGNDDSRLALNVDFAATIADATGFTFPGLEGESLLDAPVRDGFVLESLDGDNTDNRPSYCGWRSAGYVYVRYDTGEAEFYNYNVDPYELDNRINATAGWIQNLITDHRQKAKAACVPVPPGFSWNP